LSTLVFHARPGFDALTGLPDRAAFIAELKAAAIADDGVAVLFLGLDDFKVINDGFGHEAGDRVLIQVAHRLKGAVHDGDMVARIGGDEFTVLCAGADLGGATITAGRIRGALSAPFDVAGQQRHVRVSVGVRVAAPHDHDPEALLCDADTAMYQAKEAGKNRVELYSDATRARLLRRLELEQRLRLALHATLEPGSGAGSGPLGHNPSPNEPEGRGLAVHYQPQIDLGTGRLVGVEALVRWREASPAEFIPLAEETGLIAPLGAWVLRTAARALKRWHDQGLAPLSITVNVSTRQLEDPEFPRIVTEIVKDAGIAPEHLCLEITESALMGAQDAVLEALHKIKRLGVYVGIDDFGTGHSSLARLRDLPVEVLKVDRSFVDGLGTERSDSAVVAAILSLAHALGLHVIAEGVETPLQANQLTALGCPVAQGFLWSPAIPEHDLAEFAARGTGLRPRLGKHRGERNLVDEMMHQIGIAREELL
jgi:diguanylate cyclase (GGDEF)-like protein